MSDDTRWQIPGVSPEARGLARAAAEREGLGVGDWLDRVIRRRTGLAGTEISGDEAAVSQHLADTLDDLEARVAAQASGVEAMVAPIAEELDTLDARLRSAGDESAGPPDDTSDDATGDDAPRPDDRPEEDEPEQEGDDGPFYADAETASDADRAIADSAVAADLDRLFDDGAHAGTPEGDGKAAPPKSTGFGLRRRESGGSRGMLIAAAIVIVLVAIGITLYQWTQVDPKPDQAVPQPPQAQAPAAPPADQAKAPPSPPQPPRAGTDAGADTATATLPTETVELDTLADPPGAAEAADTPQDPSFTRPPPPEVAAGSTVAALHNAAAAGDPRAQYDLAVFYIQGKEVAQDYAAAAYWLREAATAGIAPAQYNLGVMYDVGMSGRKDPVEALLWFHAAADQKHARAYYALGLAYAEGKGIAKNEASARLWFTKGAEADVADAQLALGIMFDKGLGGPASPEQAYYWYRRAEIGGNERAAAQIAGLANRLSDSQRAVLNDRVSRDVTPGLARPATGGTATARPATASPAPPAPRPAAAPAPQPAPAAAAPPAPAPRETVRAIQQLLATLGFDPGPADGDSGPRTRAAIEEYQRALGLPVDGTATTGLLAHLREVAGVSDGR